jgi:hypothetical protein
LLAGYSPAHRRLQQLARRPHTIKYRFVLQQTELLLASLTSVLINIPLVARGGGQPRLTKILARALLIVIAFGVFGLLVHKPLEAAFQSVLRIRNTPDVNTH